MVKDQSIDKKVNKKRNKFEIIFITDFRYLYLVDINQFFMCKWTKRTRVDRYKIET